MLNPNCAIVVASFSKAIRVLAVGVPPSVPLSASNLIESSDLNVVGSSVAPLLLYLLAFAFAFS